MLSKIICIVLLLCPRLLGTLGYGREDELVDRGEDGDDFGSYHQDNNEDFNSIRRRLEAKPRVKTLSPFDIQQAKGAIQQILSGHNQDNPFTPLPSFERRPETRAIQKPRSAQIQEEYHIDPTTKFTQDADVIDATEMKTIKNKLSTDNAITSTLNTVGDYDIVSSNYIIYDTINSLSSFPVVPGTPDITNNEETGSGLITTTESIVYDHETNTGLMGATTDLLPLTTLPAIETVDSGDIKSEINNILGRADVHATELTSHRTTTELKGSELIFPTMYKGTIVRSGPVSSLSQMPGIVHWIQDDSESATEATFKTPNQALREEPAEELPEGPAEAPAEAPAGAPAEAPAEGAESESAEVPAEGPAGESAEGPAGESAEAPGQGPAGESAEASAEGSASELAEVPGDESAEAQAEGPTKKPDQSKETAKTSTISKLTKTKQTTTSITSTTTKQTTRRRRTRTTTTRTTTTRFKLDVPALLAIIQNLTYDYEVNLTDKLNETLMKYSIPTCETPTTTVKRSLFIDYDANATGTIVAKCFVCGLENYGIPRESYCGDAFAGDFLPLMPMDMTARGRISKFRKYCRYADVPGQLKNESQPRSVFGRWSGGCSVRWIDLSNVYTQRSCRSRERAIMGKNFASKRMAKLEMALKHVDNGCIASPMATLVPLSRGISLYARFHACVCTGSWCNSAHRLIPWTAALTFLLALSTYYLTFYIDG